MSTRRAVSVRISGQEYRIRSDADEASLQRVARHVDETMERIRQRTGAVDSVEVALLTALNLAREVLELRDGLREAAPSEALEALAERVERAVAEAAPAA